MSVTHEAVEAGSGLALGLTSPQILDGGVLFGPIKRDDFERLSHSARGLVQDVLEQFQADAQIQSILSPHLEAIRYLESQIKSLQTSLASVNQRAIFLQEALQEREEEIRNLKSGNKVNQPAVKFDQTLTIPQALVKLYQTILPPGKES